MIKMCDEMVKLREFLDKKGIIWYDNSEDPANTEELHCMIYRTKFVLVGIEISVIYGYGTIGGRPVYSSGADEKLLEMMIGDGEPEGHLTCDDIINHLAINKIKDIPEDEAKINRNIRHLIDLLHNEDREIKETETEGSDYDFYATWPEKVAEEIDELCCELFIASGGDVNWENIRKFTTACDDEFDVVEGDGDSFGWLTGVITDEEGITMYHCYG